MPPAPFIAVCAVIAMLYLAGVEVHKGAVAIEHKIVRLFKHKQAAPVPPPAPADDAAPDGDSE